MTDSWQPDRIQNAGKFRATNGRLLEKQRKRQTLVGQRRLATFGRSGGAARSECFDACGQPRQLPRNSIFVEHALGDRPVQLGLRQLKGVSGRRFVTDRDRRLDLLDESAHPAHAGPVDRRAFDDLAYAFLRRFVTGHARSR
jgi:hypothetical protein